jgi:hypothetical protein
MQMIPVMMIAVVVSAIIAYGARIRKQINERGGCPNCGTPVPAYRNPTSWRQAVWGGWTCSECRTEMDRFGHELGRLR